MIRGLAERVAIAMHDLDRAPERVWAEAEEETKLLYLDRAQVGLAAGMAALRAAGYALVPLEPTEAMIAAGDQCVEWDSIGGSGFIRGVDMSQAWRAMVAASAEPEDGG